MLLKGHALFFFYFTVCVCVCVQPKERHLLLLLHHREHKDFPQETEHKISKCVYRPVCNFRGKSVKSPSELLEILINRLVHFILFLELIPTIKINNIYMMQAQADSFFECLKHLLMCPIM